MKICFNTRTLFLFFLFWISITSIAQTYQNMAEEARIKYERGDYSGSALLYQKVIATHEGANDAHFYNLACDYALMGDKNSAFQYLDSSIANGWNDIRHMKSDSDLKMLWGEKEWTKLLSKFEAQLVEKENQLKKSTSIYFWGIYLGILLVFFFYNLFLFFSLKDVAFLYYALSIFFLSHIYTLIVPSFGYYSKELFFWLRYLPWNKGATFAFAGLMVIFHLLFVQSFLDLKQYSKRVYKVSRTLTLLLFANIVLCVVVNGTNILFFTGLLLAYLFSFVIALYCWRIGYKQAKYLVLASVFLTIGISLTLLNNMGLINYHPKLLVFSSDQVGFVVFYGLLSFALGSKINVLKQEKMEAQAKALEILEVKVQERTKEVVQQKQIIEEKHKEITDSIHYAERIQRSFLATKELLDKHLNDYFVLFQPKEAVSGDFYWAGQLHNEHFALVTADSTGHGVPGAIMSILNISCLENAVKEKINEPKAILNHTRINIIDRLKKDGSKEGGKDGMDCSIVCFDKKKTKLAFSGANNPVWIIRKNELIELLPDKMPVGKHDMELHSFNQLEIPLEKDDLIYTLTDGYPDQFGGPKGKKFMYKKLKDLLLSIASQSMPAQKEILLKTLHDWKGNAEQVDDITLIGLRV